MQKKTLNGFQGCHENALNESCEMSPHLIGLGWHVHSLLWPASGSGLDMIWKLKCQLRHIKWGLIVILKLSLRLFLSHPWNPLRGFFSFWVSLPDCERGASSFIASLHYFVTLTLVVYLTYWYRETHRSKWQGLIGKKILPNQSWCP